MPDEKNTNLDQKALEKSWNEAYALLRKSLGITDETNELSKAKEILEKKDATAEELKKAQEILAKAVKSEEETESTEEEEMTEETESTEDLDVKKSLVDTVAKSDSEAEIAMDVEPFLKSLVESIDTAIQTPLKRIARLEKAVKELSTTVQAIGKATLVGVEMQKSINEAVAKLGQIEIPSMARLRKGGERFLVNEGQEMTALEIMNKATELCRAGQLSVTDVTVLESRLQKGLGIPDHLRPFFAKKV